MYSFNFISVSRMPQISGTNPFDNDLSNGVEKLESPPRKKARLSSHVSFTCYYLLSSIQSDVKIGNFIGETKKF